MTATSPSADPEQRPAESQSEPESSRSVQSAGVFALAAAGQRALTFLLLPVYTTALLPAEYGRVSLLLSIYAASYVVLAAGLDVAVMRKYFQFPTAKGRNAYVGATWGVHALAATGVAGLASLIAYLAVPTTDVVRPGEVALTIIAAAFLAIATIVPLTLLRAEQRLRPYLLLSLLAGAGTAGFTILFVIVLDEGPAGWVVALVCANLAGIAAACFVTPAARGLRTQFDAVRDSLRLGLPLIPHALAQWALQVADRLVLATLASPTTVGIYSLGANLAVPGLVLMQSLNQGFMPTYAQAAQSRDAARRLRGVITLQVTLIVSVGLVLAVAGPPLVSVLAPGGYAGAGSVIPWLTLGYVFMGLYFVPMNTITLTLGKTKSIWLFTASAAAIALGSIPVLYDHFGISGAASASALGYGTQLVVISAYAYRAGARLDIDWFRCTAVCAAGLTLYPTLDAALPSDGLAAAATRLGTATLGAASLFLIAGQTPRGIKR